jgi:hypothetical protein
LLLKQSELPTTTHAATSKGDRKLQRWYGVHTIRSTASFSDVKNHYLVQETIQEYKAYGSLHCFELNKWDIAHLGFLQGYCNIHSISYDRLGTLPRVLVEADLEVAMLVDARNGFNELGRMAALWTVPHLWPARARMRRS